MKNKYIRLLPLVSVIIVIVAFLVHKNHVSQRFFKEKANSTVIKRNNWQLRATEFYLRNGLRVDSTGIVPLDIKVGILFLKKQILENLIFTGKIILKDLKFYKVYEKM